MNDLPPIDEEVLTELPPLDYHPQVRNRINIYTQIAHEHGGEQPQCIPTLIFSDVLQSDQDHYSRRMTATEEWKPLDHGWVHPEEVGFIILENLEGKRFAVNPTEKEKAEVAERVLEIAYSTSLDDRWPIPPRLFRIEPTERFADIRIRCRSRQAQFRIYVVPR